MSLSDKIIEAPGTFVEICKTKDIKESIKQLKDFVEGYGATAINFRIDEIFGDKLVPKSEVKRNG